MISLGQRMPRVKEHFYKRNILASKLVKLVEVFLYGDV
jgi:hypothetical protein